MIRLLGAFMIASASVSLGILYVRNELLRLRALNSVLQLLRDIRGELEARLTPLPELFSFLAQRSVGAAGSFLAQLNAGFAMLGRKEFSQLWADSVEGSLDMLDSVERETLKALGRSLGRYELSRQLQELDMCVSRLEGCAARRSSALPEKKRLGFGLAWAGGALLVIVLI